MSAEKHSSCAVIQNQLN